MHLVNLVFLEFLVKMVSLVHLVKEELLVNMVLKDLLEYPVLLDHPVQLGSLGRLESLVFLELLVCPENLVGLVNQERKDLQAPLGLKADLAYQVHLVCQDSLEKEVFPDFRECLA